jgi:UDP-GlcNAc:undecaprenyl-phosphate/decaprenyl-phosphate GlcNAc-1-phosphate transferase
MTLGLHQPREAVFYLFHSLSNLFGLWPCLAAGAASTALTAFLVKIAPRKGWVVIPRQNRWNKRVVAQFGGVPILLAFSAFGLLLPSLRQVLPLLLLTVGMGLLGLVDDLVGLGPKPKLIVQLVLAVIAVHVGIVHPITHTPFFNAAFKVFWIVGITNAFNLIDNIDGLAAGIGIIALAQIVLLAGMDSPVTVLALVLLASASGFLVFNLNPAKVFMGDVGSLSIGFFLACASLMAAAHLSSRGSVLLVPCLVLFIPIFDMLLVSVTRRLNGRAISRGARDHTSHRLVFLGLTEHQAVVTLYGIALSAGALAVFREKFWPDWGVGFLALFLISATLFWVYLAKLHLPDTWLSEPIAVIISVPSFFRRTSALLCVLLLDSLIIVLGFYFACLTKLDKWGPFFLAQFWIVAAASILVKLVFLTASGAYRGEWGLSGLKQCYPVVRGVFLAACFAALAWLALRSPLGLPPVIIAIDAVFTAALLLLIRSSTGFFDFLLARIRSLSAAHPEELTRRALE